MLGQCPLFPKLFPDITFLQNNTIYTIFPVSFLWQIQFQCKTKR